MQSHIMKFISLTHIGKSSVHLIYLLGFIICIVALSSCNGGSSKPDLSAIPHAEALPSTELSEADKKKLQNAIGKQVESINMTDLQNMLSASTNKLYVYAFWHSACKVCLSNIDNLKEVASQIGSDKMQVITLNLGETAKKVNLMVRSQNIAFETYQLKIQVDNWNTLLDVNWDGSLPAMFLVNESEEIFLKYYKSMEASELHAIIQTLII